MSPVKTHFNGLINSFDSLFGKRGAFDPFVFLINGSIDKFEFGQSVQQRKLNNLMTLLVILLKAINARDILHNRIMTYS